MRKSMKKAFTITELVIVIAVVAILAAVLIPTFSNVIQKAQESSDIQAVRNLNTILSTEELSNNRANTIDEALEQALASGYKVENLTPTREGREIVWDSVNNRFALIDSEGNKVFGDSATPDVVVGKQFWKFTNDYSKTSNGDYSWYLTSEATLPVDETTGTLEVTSSINLSAFPELKSVSVPATATGTIDITTNNENLDVYIASSTQANSATINLYGVAGKIGTKASSGSLTGGQFGNDSLHIYGEVEEVYVRSGKVVAEEGSKIDVIITTASVANNAISIELKQGCRVDNIATTYDQWNASLLDAITGDITFTKVIEDRVVHSLSFGGGIGTKEYPYIINKVENFNTINTYSFWLQKYDGDTAFFKLGADIEFSNAFATNYSTIKVNIDLAGHTITNKVAETDNITAAFIIQKGCTLTIEDSVGTGKIVTPNTYEQDNIVGYLFTVIGTDPISTLVINGGNFEAGMTVAQVDGSSAIVVNGGKFTTLVPNENGVYFVLNKIDASASSITVSGGTFVNFNPAEPGTGDEIIVNGTVVDNADGSYTVQPNA